MRTLFSLPIQQCRPIPFSSLMSRPDPYVHQPFPPVPTLDSCGNEILCMGWQGVGAIFWQIPGQHNGRTVFQGSRRNWVSNLDGGFPKIFYGQK